MKKLHCFVLAKGDHFLEKRIVGDHTLAWGLITYCSRLIKPNDRTEGAAGKERKGGQHVNVFTAGQYEENCLPESLTASIIHVPTVLRTKVQRFSSWSRFLRGSLVCLKNDLGATKAVLRIGFWSFQLSSCKSAPHVECSESFTVGIVIMSIIVKPYIKVHSTIYCIAFHHI